MKTFALIHSVSFDYVPSLQKVQRLSTSANMHVAFQNTVNFGNGRLTSVQEPESAAAANAVPASCRCGVLVVHTDIRGYSACSDDVLKMNMTGRKKEKEKNFWAWWTKGSSGFFCESTWVPKATLAITSMRKQRNQVVPQGHTPFPKLQQKKNNSRGQPR
ncbi:hypothetical protein JZ751_006269 [Albula glossodonta]|uniref:Uncharacterized protein n=1 Tax=Albula glossodonta TaxID=121402 RepID=A0A8T2NEP9_9TELE|nr:hypothetical protein JZ751_006269 [Albula glossodonta]